jgi:hypothetical protein
VSSSVEARTLAARVFAGEEDLALVITDRTLWQGALDLVVATIIESSPDALKVAAAGESLPHELQEAFLARVAAGVANAPESAHVWVERLCGPEARRSWIRRRGLEEPGVLHTLRGEAARERSASSPFRALSPHRQRYIDLNVTALDLLWRLDLRRFCEVLDSLPGSTWTASALFWLQKSPEELLRALEVAPLVFERGGAWTRSVAAVALFDHAMSRPGSDLARCARSLLARDDGPLLALGFSARHERGDDVPDLVSSLTTLTPAAAITPDAVEALWMDSALPPAPATDRGPDSPSSLGARAPSLRNFTLWVAYARVLLEGTRATDPRLRDARSAAWRHVVESLRRRDDGVPSMRDVAKGLVPSAADVLVGLLCRQPDPVTSYRQLLVALDDILERLAHRTTADDYDVDNPLRLAVYLGARGATLQDLPPGVRRALHAEAVTYARRLDQARGYDHAHHRELLLVAIGLAPLTQDTPDARELSELLRWVREPVWDLLSAASLMWRNQLAERCLVDALALVGIEMVALRRSFDEARTLGMVPDGRYALLRDLSEQLPKWAPDEVPTPEREEVVVRGDGRRLVARGPFGELEPFGVSQPLALLRTDHPPTSADLTWAAEQLDGHAARVDGEVLLVPVVGVGLPTPYTAVPLAATATDAVVVQAVSAALRESDPFERRQVVKGVQFVGRREVVQALTNDLARFEVTGIFGLRRIGKTSTAFAAAAALGEGFTPVYVDVQAIVQRDVSGVAHAIARALGERLDLPQLAAIDPDRTEQEMVQALERALERPPWRRAPLPCLLLDEFDLLFADALGRPTDGDVDRLLAVLHRAVRDKRLAWMLIGRDPSRFHERGARGDGVLHGAVREHWLRPLTRVESEELLVGLGRRCGMNVSPRNSREAYEIVGGHPLLLRLYGRELRRGRGEAEAARRAFVVAADVRELVAGALFTAARLSPLMWEVVSPWLLGERGAPLPSSALPWLRELGLLRDDGQFASIYTSLGPLLAPAAPARAA